MGLDEFNWMTASEVAKRTKCFKSEVYYLAKIYKLPTKTNEKGHKLFDLAALTPIIKEHYTLKRARLTDIYTRNRPIYLELEKRFNLALEVLFAIAETPISLHNLNLVNKAKQVLNEIGRGK